MNMDERMIKDKEYLERAKRMQFIGTTEDSFEYLHPDSNIYTDKFSFYWNMSNSQIDICHGGCNGSIFGGTVNEDGSITFSRIPRGYPKEDVFEKEFLKLQKEFLNRS